MTSDAEVWREMSKLQDDINDLGMGNPIARLKHDLANEQATARITSELLVEARQEIGRLQVVLADKERLAHRLAAECVERLKDQERLRAALISIAGLEAECEQNPGWSGLIVAVSRANAVLARDKAD